MSEHESQAAAILLRLRRISRRLEQAVSLLRELEGSGEELFLVGELLAALAPAAWRRTHTPRALLERRIAELERLVEAEQAGEVICPACMSGTLDVNGWCWFCESHPGE